MARVSRWKRHDLTLSAFEHVAKSHSKVHLVCIGAKDSSEPDWWDYLQKRTRQSPFSRQIHWLGQVDDVRPWYQSAYMLVLPSENEPFGRVLVEAMACGVPVIANRSGGVPEIVRHGQDGLLVAPGKENEMAEAMAKILQNESFRKYASQLAWERARLFSLDRHVDRMIQVFEETISRPS